MARLFEIFFEIDRVVAEGGLGLGPRDGQRLGQVDGGAGDLHAAPAAARRRLDQHRKADVPGDAHRLVVVGHAAFGARHAGNAERPRGALGLDLVAHDADMFGLGADEADVVVGENFGEFGVFRQEAIAGMDGVGAGDLAGGEQGRNVEIGVARRRRADAHQFVGQLHMHGFGVGGRMDGDGGDSQLLRRAQDAEGDFAAIGDKDFFEHQEITSRGWSYSTGWASSTRMAVTVPVLCATMSLKVFIASISNTFWPVETCAPISMKGLASGLGRR